MKGNWWNCFCRLKNQTNFKAQKIFFSSNSFNVKEIFWLLWSLLEVNRIFLKRKFNFLSLNIWNFIQFLLILVENCAVKSWGMKPVLSFGAGKYLKLKYHIQSLALTFLNILFKVRWKNTLQWRVFKWSAPWHFIKNQKKICFRRKVLLWKWAISIADLQKTFLTFLNKLAAKFFIRKLLPNRKLFVFSK